MQVNHIGFSSPMNQKAFGNHRRESIQKLARQVSSLEANMIVDIPVKIPPKTLQTLQASTREGSTIMRNHQENSDLEERASPGFQQE